MTNVCRSFVSMFILCALALEVVAFCFRNWFEGYYGDIVVVDLCPWRLCHLNCLRCSEEKPTVSCFWIDSWQGTGFESFSVVAHLEYWCLGLLTLGLLVSILDWVQSNIRHRTGCPVEFTKPSLLVLTVASVLSTLSISLFGANIGVNPSEITTYDDVIMYFGWPYVARLVAGLMTWAATGVAIWCHYRSITARSRQAAGENIVVISSERELDVDDCEDEAENSVLL